MLFLHFFNLFLFQIIKNNILNLLIIFAPFKLIHLLLHKLLLIRRNTPLPIPINTPIIMTIPNKINLPYAFIIIIGTSTSTLSFLISMLMLIMMMMTIDVLMAIKIMLLLLLILLITPMTTTAPSLLFIPLIIIPLLLLRLLFFLFVTAILDLICSVFFGA